MQIKVTKTTEGKGNAAGEASKGKKIKQDSYKKFFSATKVLIDEIISMWCSL